MIYHNKTRFWLVFIALINITWSDELISSIGKECFTIPYKYNSYYSLEQIKNEIWVDLWYKLF